MVAWQMTLHTPEYPDGRDIIVICNDITHQIGSFGPNEDMLFLRASQRARNLGVITLHLMIEQKLNLLIFMVLIWV